MTSLSAHLSFRREVEGREVTGTKHSARSPDLCDVKGRDRRINTSFYLSLLPIERRTQEDVRKLGSPFIESRLGSSQDTDRVGKSWGKKQKTFWPKN